MSRDYIWKATYAYRCTKIQGMPTQCNTWPHCFGCDALSGSLHALDLIWGDLNDDN